jgi:hypothetical protein
MDFSAAPNFKIGPIRFGLAAGVGLNYNDNLAFSDHQRQDDLVFRPTLQFDGAARFSDRNMFRFSLGLSYAKHFEHPEYDTDGVLIAPGSAFEYLFKLGSKLTVSLHDRLTYLEDAFDVPVLSHRAQYGRWENRAGLAIQFEPSDTILLGLGYEHYSLQTKNDLYRTQDRSIDGVSFKPSWQFHPKLRLGFDAAYGRITFASDDRPQGDHLTAGAFMEWIVTEDLTLFLEGGFQSLSFDGDYHTSRVVDEFSTEPGFSVFRRDITPSAASDRDRTQGIPYWRAEFTHHPTEYFTQRLTGARTLEVGFFSNYYDIYQVEYALEWKALSNTILTPRAFYEHYETSGPFAERANRLGAEVGVVQVLPNSVSLMLNYRFVCKDSNLSGFDYRQNLTYLGLYYAF